MDYKKKLKRHSEHRQIKLADFVHICTRTHRVSTPIQLSFSLYSKGKNNYYKIYVKDEYGKYDCTREVAYLTEYNMSQAREFNGYMVTKSEESCDKIQTEMYEIAKEAGLGNMISDHVLDLNIEK